MATAQQIADLRRKINEPNDVDPYTDLYLGTLIDTGLELRLIAANIWEEKATQVLDLVNISEGGSSRANSQLHSNYLAMAKQLRTDDNPTDDADARLRAPRTREAVRQ